MACERQVIETVLFPDGPPPISSQATLEAGRCSSQPNIKHSPKSSVVSAGTSNSKKTFLYELDPSTIMDKKERLKVEKAIKSKNYRDKVKMLAAGTRTCCLGLCGERNEAFLELLKVYQEVGEDMFKL